MEIQKTGDSRIKNVNPKVCPVCFCSAYFKKGHDTDGNVVYFKKCNHCGYYYKVKSHGKDN